MPKLKVKASSLADVDVKYVSLVKRPANRIPFRLCKGDEVAGDDLGVKPMFNLSSLFRKGDEDAAAPASPVAAVVIHKNDLERGSSAIEEAGFSIADPIVQEDVIILKQYDFDEKDVTPIKVSDEVVLLVKGFEPYQEDLPFLDRVMAQGFMPGVGVATDAMMIGVNEILQKAEDPEAAKDEITTIIKGYSKHVMKLASALPPSAFRIGSMGPETFKSDEEKSGDEAIAETAQKEDATDEDATKKSDAEDDKATSAATDVAEPDTTAKMDEKATEEEEAVATPNPLDAVLGALTSFKDEVANQFTALRGEMEVMKKSAEAAADKATTATASVEAVQATLKGTIVSGSDTQEDHVGTKTAKKEDDLWNGTALDNLG